MVKERKTKRMGRPQRWLLYPAHKRNRLDTSRTMAGVHSTDASRASLPHPQKRPRHPADLAPDVRARPGAHPRVLFSVPGRRAAPRLQRNRQHPQRRHRAAHPQRTGNTKAMRGAAHRTSGNTASTAGLAAAIAPEDA